MVDRFLEQAVECFAIIGMPASMIRRVAHWPAWVVDVALGDAFVQTPGPGAGQRLQATP
jgi:hypothetical protein